MEFAHRPVMPGEVIKFLDVRPGGLFADCTTGGGGHTRLMLEASAPDGVVVALDRDRDAIEAARKNLKEFGERVIFVKADFRDLKEALSGLGKVQLDGVLFDLGVSSYQLEEPGRGFSFRFEAPLDMRMDRDRETTAAMLVNGLGAAELERIFREYGEEREARRIARAIVEARGSKPVETTGELVRIILSTVPKRFQAGRIHPATRVFQALRIAVNDELESVSKGVAAGIEALKPGGRIAVITFHSLEDRIVKNIFREEAAPCVCPPRLPMCVCGRKPRLKLLTRKVAAPAEKEIEENPRARSAKLRAAERV